MAAPAVLGAIIGDIAGSTRESRHWKVPNRDFELFDVDGTFTDDTVLTIAVAEAVRTDGDFMSSLHRWANRYPRAGFGGMFRDWMAAEDPQPYSSFGNGSVMRVSPVAYASDDPDAVLDLAEQSAAVTHNHPEGIKGAQAVAAAILVARLGGSVGDVRATITGCGYDLGRSVGQWRSATTFDVTCMGTVPAAVQAVLEATDLEGAVRNAVYIGGDSDTLAAVAGAIGAALWGVPGDLARAALERLDRPLVDQLVDFDSWSAAITEDEQPG